MGKEVPDQVAAASRNDADQILGVLLESISLERIDLVADDAGYRHHCPLLVRRGRCMSAQDQHPTHRHNALNGFAASYFSALCSVPHPPRPPSSSPTSPLPL